MAFHIRKSKRIFIFIFSPFYRGFPTTRTTFPNPDSNAPLSTLSIAGEGFKGVSRVTVRQSLLVTQHLGQIDPRRACQTQVRQL